MSAGGLVIFRERQLRIQRGRARRFVTANA